MNSKVIHYRYLENLFDMLAYVVTIHLLLVIKTILEHKLRLVFGYTNTLWSFLLRVGPIWEKWMTKDCIYNILYKCVCVWGGDIIP